MAFRGLYGYRVGGTRARVSGGGGGGMGSYLCVIGPERYPGAAVFGARPNQPGRQGRRGRGAVAAMYGKRLGEDGNHSAQRTEILERACNSHPPICIGGATIPAGGRGHGAVVSTPRRSRTFDAFARHNAAAVGAPDPARGRWGAPIARRHCPGPRFLYDEHPWGAHESGFGAPRGARHE